MATAAALSARHGICPAGGRLNNYYDYPAHSSVGTSSNGDFNYDEEASGQTKGYQPSFQW